MVESWLCRKSVRQVFNRSHKKRQLGVIFKTCWNRWNLLQSLISVSLIMMLSNAWTLFCSVKFSPHIRSLSVQSMTPLVIRHGNRISTGRAVHMSPHNLVNAWYSGPGDVPSKGSILSRSAFLTYSISVYSFWSQCAFITLNSQYCLQWSANGC